ncbi:MAG: ABC transporter ATP-binding protein [Clostridia bacterium]|nr:ABC transporter ATP-binding protein [Clostridia bacterium]
MKIVFEHLTKTFPGKGKKATPVTAVNDFNFEIPDGKLIGLLGPSGCGKSTALNLLCGLIKPTSGKIYFGEDDVTEVPPENRGVGFVFQNYALYPHLTVKQNIMFPLQNLKGKDKLSKEVMEQKALEAAKLVQIDSLMDRKPGEMSGGQQQRVAIARALVKMPRVLLMDEPLSNLDARLRLQTREEIRRIQNETKITTIFVTHDQDEAMSISDLIVVMKLGVIQQMGKPQQVYDDPANLFVATFLGTPPINVFDARVKNGQIFIGDEAILDIKGVADGEYTAAIRPEGFILGENGRFTCNLDRVEVMGRDISVVSRHNSSKNDNIRSIISSNNEVDENARIVKFDVRPNKIFLFAKTEAEERVYFTEGECPTRGRVSASRADEFISASEYSINGDHDEPARWGAEA